MNELDSFGKNDNEYGKYTLNLFQQGFSEVDADNKPFINFTTDGYHQQFGRFQRNTTGDHHE